MHDKVSGTTNADPPRRLPASVPRITFARVLVIFMALFCCAMFVFWLTCIRQPGVSFAKSPAEEFSPRSSTDGQVPEAPQSIFENQQETVPPKPVEVRFTKIEKQLKKYIRYLSDTIGERNLRNIKKLNAAAGYIEAEFKAAGYRPNRQTYKARGFDCHNIDAEIKGSKRPKEIIIIGAHYDSVVGTPGANDNGSGTAAMLVLASHFAKSKPERTLRFVAWTNEEPPYFQNRGLMGSWVYAEACRQRNEDIKAVLSLETMGYFTDAKDSQKYPAPLNLLYPSTGNFIGFVANMNSRGLQRRVIKMFRKHAKIPSEGAALPDALPGVGWSDHWSFWQEGYAGIMVTDTAPFRYPHYHKKTDTADKINYSELAKVVEGLKFVVQDLTTSKTESGDKQASTKK